MGKAKTLWLGAVLVAGCGMLVMTGAASAQASCGNTGAAGVNCSITGIAQVTTTVAHIVYMSVTPNSVGLTAPTDADFTAGATTQKVNPAAQTLTIRSNAVWTVSLTGFAWTAPYAKAVGDLEFTTDGGANYTPVTTGAQDLATAQAATGAGSITIGYRTAWDVGLDVPGVYTMPITLTITGN